MGRRAKKGKARPWRWWLGRVLSLTILALILTTASIPSEKVFDLRLSPFVDDRRFDWVGWETNAVLEEIDWRLRGRPITDDVGSEIGLVEGRDEVLAFLDRSIGQSPSGRMSL